MQNQPQSTSQPSNPHPEQSPTASQNKSYGFEIPTKQQLKQIKRKVQILKQAIIKQRTDRQAMQQQLKQLNQQCLSTEQLLHKKQQKNQNLLHQSRQLKDILIREKQEIKNLENQIQAIKDKNKKSNPRGSKNIQVAPGQEQQQQQQQGWKSYLTSFWK